MSESNGNLYRYSVEIRCFGHVVIHTVEARSEAEALRMVQETVGYRWEIKPLAFAKYTQ